MCPASARADLVSVKSARSATNPPETADSAVDRDAATIRHRSQANPPLLGGDTQANRAAVSTREFSAAAASRSLYKRPVLNAAPQTPASPRRFPGYPPQQGQNTRLQNSTRRYR